MLYFSIYNPATKEIDCKKSFPDSKSVQADLEWQLWPLECQNRGGGWQAHRGPEPYEFPVMEEPAPDA